MDHETEVIRQRMDETRESLAEKLATLENKVVGAVTSTTDAVTETIDSVKEGVQTTIDTLQHTVTDTVDAVKSTVSDTVDNVTHSVTNTVDQVRDSLDVRQHVRNNPWASLGVAVAAGFALGMAANALRPAPRRKSRGGYQPYQAPVPPAPPSEPLADRVKKVVNRVQQWDLPAPVQQAAHTVKDLAMKALTDVTKAVIAGSVVGPLQQTLTNAVEQFTKNVNPDGATVTGDRMSSGVGSAAEPAHTNGHSAGYSRRPD